MFITCLLCMSAMGQWEALQQGLFGDAYDLIYDATDSSLYVGGEMWISLPDSVEVNGIARWKDGSWSGLDGGVQNMWGQGVVPAVHSMVKFYGHLVVAGVFKRIGDTSNTYGTAQYVNGAWQSLGIDSSDVAGINPWRVMELNGELHLLGAFRIEGADTLRNWAIYDGSDWRPGDTTEVFYFNTSSLAEYQGQLYLGGNFDTQAGYNDLVKQGPSGWEPVGQGILGDPWVNDLMVYDDLLWVVGEFAAAAGNAANGLMAWDGSQWLNPFPQISLAYQGRDLLVANGKLYFAGAMQVSGLSGLYRIGVYDGQQLCILGGPDLFVLRIAASSDSIYITTCKYLHCLFNGPLVGNVAKWPLDAPMDTCFNVSVGVSELESIYGEEAVLAYPNPSSGSFALHWPDVLPSDLTLHAHNGLGAAVPIQWHRVDVDKVQVELKGTCTGLVHIRWDHGTGRGSKTLLLE